VDKLLEHVEDRAVVHGVFNDPKKVVAALKQLKSEDLGLSVVVSGLFDKVRECCKSSGLTPHTVNNALGRWGRTGRLPPPDVLEINTMCGHGRVTVKLIEGTAAKVERGEMTAEQGAERLFKPCMCGIFNADRAAKLLTAMAGEQG
jgi:hypothetical protein